MPRTTIDLDPGVLRDLKRRQKQEGKTLGRLVSELLTVALSDAARESPVPFEWTAENMGVGVDLEDKEAVRRALEGS